MNYIIDRIEAGIAVLECQSTGAILEIPKSALPKKVREGQVLLKSGEEYIIDLEATEQRRLNIKKRLEKLLGRSVK